MSILTYGKVTKFNSIQLPDITASLSDKAAVIDDTNFLTSHGFKTRLVGLKDWQIAFNGFMGRKAGYLSTVKVSGTSTEFTDAETTLVTGHTYKISDATKNCWDQTVVPTVKDGGAALSGGLTVLSVDYMFGTITLSGAPSGAVTISGSYIPLAEIYGSKGFSLKMQGDVRDATTFASAQANSGAKTNAIGLIDISASVDRFEDLSGDYIAMLDARAAILIENSILGGDLVTRGWFVLPGSDKSGGVADEEMEKLDLQLAGAATTNFSYQATASLNTGLKALLDNFFARTAQAIDYLPDGENGVTGDGLVSQFNIDGDLGGVEKYSGQIVAAGALSEVTA